MSVFKFFGNYILFLFNLLCLVSSFGILAIAYIIKERFYHWSKFSCNELTTTPVILAIIGLVLFLIAIVGLCGVLRDSACLLTLFSIFLSMVLIGEIVLSGIVYNTHSEIESYVLKEMENSMNTFNKTGYEVSTHIWDVMQYDMKCCGVHGPNDWYNVTNSDKLPKSCCIEFPVAEYCKTSLSFQEGCFNKFSTNLHDNNQLIMWSAVGFGLIQLLAVCLACCRKCSIHDAYETV